MTDLPPALAPWGPELRSLPIDLAQAIAPLVTSIAAAIGSPRSSAAHTIGEPDGFDGLARRGSYARLLSSEWLLASEAPDEFTRRAAMGEHAFLALGRSQPKTSFTLTALFDAGPSAIGAPRIGQVAILVVLAQRARRLGAAFRWGVLQDRREPFADLGAESIRAFLAARSGDEPTDDDVARRATEPEGERWLVVGRHVAALAPADRRVTIEDVDEPSAARIAVRIERRGEPVRSLALDLPAPHACARLIRDPFTAPAPVTKATGALSDASILLSSDARRLLVRLAAGPLLAYPIPNSPRGTPGKPVRFAPPEGCDVLAADWSRGRFHVVVRDGSRLRLHVLGKGGGPVHPPREIAPEGVHDDAGAASSGLARLVDLAERRFAFANGKGSIEIAGDAFRQTLRRVITRRGTMTLIGFGVSDGDGQPRRRLALVARDESVTWVYESSPSNGDGEVRFGYAPSDVHPDVGLLALRTGARTWTVFTGGGVATLDELGDFRCIGVTDGGALVGIEQDRRVVSVLGRRQSREVIRAGAPIAEACVSAAGPLAAYRTDAGELVVCKMHDGTVLLRVLGGTP